MPQQPIPPIGADVSSLMPVGSDVSSLMGGGSTAKPAAAPAPPEKSWLDSAKDYLGESLKSLSPSAINDGIQQAFWHPIDTIGAIGQAQGGLKEKAEAAFKSGDYATGLRHSLNYLIPLLGPRLDQAGDFMQQGEFAKGLGATTDVAVQAFGPQAAARAVPRTTRALTPNKNPAEAAAVAFGQKHGIPIDAATATGNPFVRGTQKLADQSLGGSVIGQKAQAAQARGLATVGEQLAAKANPRAVTAEQAGQGVRDAVLGQVRKHAGDADEAYTALRTIENDPANASVIYPEERIPSADAPFRFVSKPKATADEIFLSALQDARKQGYTGSAAELKGAFDDQVKSARSLAQETNGAVGEYGDAALLKSIRDLGGLRMFDKDFTPGAKTARMTEEFDNVKSYFRGQRVYTERGLANDDLVQQLRQDPRWAQRIDENADMNEVLRDIAAQQQQGGGRGAIDPQSAIDLQGALHGVGVRPGVQWWRPNDPQTINMAIDLRPAKTALRPIYDELMATYPLAQQQASKGLKALDNIINGPDHAPLSVVDRNLSAIKSISRTDLPELRSVSQGTAAGAVKQLDALVRARAAEAGPLAAEALDAGRKSTTAKYLAADVLDSLNAEPVRTQTGLTAPRDSAIQKLRAVAKQAPETMPQIARSVLDGFLEKATEAGGFAHADKLYADWQKLGPGTKSLLFKDQAYIKDLDHFFLLAKKIAENPNPSGSALTWAKGGELTLMATNPIAGAATAISAAALSKLLHSPAGVRLLTKGFRLPGGSKAAATAYGAELSQALGRIEQGMDLAPAYAGEEKRR